MQNDAGLAFAGQVYNHIDPLGKLELAGFFRFVLTITGFLLSRCGCSSGGDRRVGGSIPAPNCMPAYFLHLYTLFGVVHEMKKVGCVHNQDTV